MPRPILVTSALPYANGPIHLGHLAGAYLPADFFVRYLRLKGEDVVFVCGSDEMGVAIEVRARKEGRTPQDVIDEFHAVIEGGLRAAGMSFDVYGRTSALLHKATTSEIFRQIATDPAEDIHNDQGAFRLGTSEQLFDPEAGVFLADRFVVGTCPVCGNPNAYGDQCERCGSTLSPAELIDPRSALTSATPIRKETTHWMLPLGDVQPLLEGWLRGDRDGLNRFEAWKPNVTGQIRSWLEAGLRDRAITRDIAWGIPVPEDLAEAAGVDASGKVIYVWFDAPIGYVSNTKAWAEAQGDPERWTRYWRTHHEDGTAKTGDDAPRLVHFIGKDNIVFHGLVFPAMLMLTGGYVLPEAVPANEFLNLEGEKFSTSRGHAIWLHDFLERFPADTLRYALGTMLPETKDADFNLSEFQGRVNGDLADVLGNFVHRALTFTHRQFGGAVPTPGAFSAEAQAVLDAIAAAPEQIGALYASYRFRDALYETIDLARTGNKFFNDAAPWHQIKTDAQAAQTTLYVSLQLCASLSILLEPIVPDAAARLRRMLNLAPMRSSMPAANLTGSENLSGDLLGWNDAARPLLPPGHALGAPEVLFQKLDDAVIQAERDRLAAPTTPADDSTAPQVQTVPDVPVYEPVAEAETPAFAPLADTIVYDDFAKIDLRAGKIVVAERIPKADKLLRLEIDLGFETRQILSGIAEHFTPDEVLGRTVVIVANLAPRKMRGLESAGMILMAEGRDGKLRFVETDAEPGATVR
ncbi:MAG: methionine--tRNA ligase [Bacteroidetes bacterium]|nr:methionine--tRNA ligase [Bacteroidota bacterium]